MPDSKEISELQRLLNHNPSEEMEKENPWENDFAERKQFAYKFVTIVENIGAESTAVILLDGEWGTGKTYFLKSFRQELDNRGYKAIYFDAYAEDFSSDPLVAICGQLWKELGGDSRTQENLTKTLNSFMALGEAVFPQLSVIQKIRSIAKKRPEPLEEYVNSRKNLEGLKDELSKAAKSQPQEGEAKPLVFIIDELDRCRPTFALELLERVKHLFRIPGIIFILGANKKSLIKSMKMEYGKQKPEYFEKFFDWELVLPNAIKPAALAQQFIDKLPHKVLVENFGDHEYKKLTDTHVLKDLYYPLINIMEFTFRQAEISAKLLMLCLLLIEKSSIKNVDDILYKIGAIVCLVVLKVKRVDLYNDIAQGKESKEIIIKMDAVFEKSSYYGRSETEYCRKVFNSSIYCLSIGKERKKILESIVSEDLYVGNWEKIKEILSDDKINRSEFVAMLENLHCSDKPSSF